MNSVRNAHRIRLVRSCSERNHCHEAACHPPCPAAAADQSRDIYYRDVALFKSQVVVDKLVDDMVATAGLRRGDFNVVSTGRDLTARTDIGSLGFADVPSAQMQRGL